MNLFPEIKLPKLYTKQTKMRQLMHKIALAHNLSISAIRSRAKNKCLASARREFALIAYKDIEELTQQDIADFLNRDVSSVNSMINETSTYYQPKLAKNETYKPKNQPGTSLA